MPALAVLLMLPTGATASTFDSAQLAQWRASDDAYRNRDIIGSWEKIAPLVDAGATLDDPRQNIFFAFSVARAACHAGKLDVAKAAAKRFQDDFVASPRDLTTAQPLPGAPAEGFTALQDMLQMRDVIDDSKPGLFYPRSFFLQSEAFESPLVNENGFPVAGCAAGKSGAAVSILDFKPTAKKVLRAQVITGPRAVSLEVSWRPKSRASKLKTVRSRVRVKGTKTVGLRAPKVRGQWVLSVNGKDKFALAFHNNVTVR